MNKQAFAFLTLFSLILLLSVYYVTLPPDDALVMKVEDPTKVAPKDNADVLKKNIEKDNEKEIKKNGEIIANDKVKGELKQEALVKIDQLKQQRQNEEELVLKLKEIGYQSVVEIKDKNCKVSIFKQKANKEVAGKIIKQIDEWTKKKYFTEVSFK
ncbi:MAG: hypothetical protein RR863_03575 [Erysipelotrichaceae bacterium]